MVRDAGPRRERVRLGGGAAHVDPPPLEKHPHDGSTSRLLCLSEMKIDGTEVRTVLFVVNWQRR